MNWKRYKRVTPVNPRTINQGSSFFGSNTGFLRRTTRSIIKGVATRNRRKPRSIGSISMVTISTTINDPAQTNETRIRRNAMMRFLFMNIENSNVVIKRYSLILIKQDWRKYLLGKECTEPWYLMYNKRL
jgi:hypothetical protein